MSVWEEVRREFPVAARCVYLDTAATGPTPRPVREAVTQYYQSLEDAGGSDWSRWIDRKERIRERVAGFVGADADEIAFVTNTSTGVNLVADLIAGAGAVLSNELEFPAITLPFVHRGTAVHLLPAADGIVRLEAFDRSQAPRAATIAVSHVQFSNGCRLDMPAFGAIKSHRYLVVGGSQSVGAFPTDVHAWGVDALACAGHKWLCAGHGAGFVFIARALLARCQPHAVGWMSVKEPFAFDNRRIDLRESASRSEMGCPSLGAIFALGAAVDFLLDIGPEAIATRILELNLYLTSRLAQADFEVLSPPDPFRSGQTLCGVPEPEQAAAFLGERHVVVTPRREGLSISTHFFNNEEDIDRCVGALIAYRERLE